MVRKLTIFVGKAQGLPKGAKGYDRNQQKQQTRKDNQ